MKGMDLMVGSLLKTMGLDADKVQKTAEGIGNMIVDIVHRLDRIERKQDEILAKLSGALPVDVETPQENIGDSENE